MKISREDAKQLARELNAISALSRTPPEHQKRINAAIRDAALAGFDVWSENDPMCALWDADRQYGLVRVEERL